MRDYTHGGEGRLFQLRRFVQAVLQLKQIIIENYDHVEPYGIKSRQSVIGVAWHPNPQTRILSRETALGM
jgi:hypothetical protein